MKPEIEEVGLYDDYVDYDRPDPIVGKLYVYQGFDFVPIEEFKVDYSSWVMDGAYLCINKYETEIDDCDDVVFEIPPNVWVEMLFSGNVEVYLKTSGMWYLTA